MTAFVRSDENEYQLLPTPPVLQRRFHSDYKVCDPPAELHFRYQFYNQQLCLYVDVLVVTGVSLWLATVQTKIDPEKGSRTWFIAVSTSA